MKLSRLLFVVALILAFCPKSFPQLPATNAAESREEREKARAELEKKAVTLLERTLEDASLLKLPENRAYINANVADFLWKRDEKRARHLFRAAAAELILAQAEFEKLQSETPMPGMQTSLQRNQILQMIARRDAELALELLVSTRSAALAAEMQKVAAEAAAGTAPQPAAARIEPGQIRDFESRALVQNELRLEQNFAALAAHNDPQRAAKLIRESMAKNGVTGEVWNSLQRLHPKDEEAAKALLAETVSKLLESDLSKRENERQAAAQFLMRFSIVRRAPQSSHNNTAATTASVNKTPFQPDERMLRDVAGKMVDAFLQAKNFASLNEINRLLPTLEKLIPERAATLRQKQAALKKTMTTEQTRQMENLNSLNNPNATPEERIKNAAKAPQGMRQSIYRDAVSKMVQSGEAERARQLLAEAPAGAERDRALELLDSLVAQKAVKDGKMDEARRIIGGLKNKNTQIEQLVLLARNFQAKNTKEDREVAARLMEEAARLMYDVPQSEEETNALLAIIAGYAVIEPNRAFLLLDPLVEQVNEVMQATAVLSKYNRQDFRFRNGEMSYVFGTGRAQSSLFRFRRELGLLAAADFERTRNLTDRFTRQDVQILTRLTLAQSILQERIPIEGAGIGAFGGGFNLAN